MLAVNATNASPRPFFDRLETDYDPDTRIVRCYMGAQVRPCFTPELLRDLSRFLKAMRNQLASERRAGCDTTVDYVVFGSRHPGAFSLGGDLRMFVDLIRRRDRNALTAYMELSIQVMYDIAVNMDQPITTIAVVEGNALGAGLEGALACDVIVAERSVEFGFPEVLFNMFPGMGAYSFLARRLDPARVERMILSGRIFSAQEMFDMGLVDVLAEDGGAEAALNTLLRRLDKARNTQSAVMQMRKRVFPISYDEMLDVGRIWVNAAMGLGERELRTMERLIRSQDRRTADASADSQAGGEA